MRKDRASDTAEAALAIRALESSRPSESRLFQDPYSARLLRSHHRALLRLCRLSSVRTGLERYLDWKFPGVQSDFICRTRYIDEKLDEALAFGCDRVVIIGAGYDTRSFRLALKKRLDVIEIDHPLTQQRKVRKISGIVPANTMKRVRFVSQDLMVSLDSSVSASKALSGPARTVFVLEGLTGYLSAESVASLFRWMRANSLAGSRVIFTYVDRDFVEGRWESTVAQRISDHLNQLGEPFRFGWKASELGNYCRDRGFRLLETVSATECANRYLKPLSRELETADFFHLAVAEVEDGDL